MWSGGTPCGAAGGDGAIKGAVRGAARHSTPSQHAARRLLLLLRTMTGALRGCGAALLLLLAVQAAAGGVQAAAPRPAGKSILDRLLELFTPKDRYVAPRGVVRDALRGPVAHGLTSRCLSPTAALVPPMTTLTPVTTAAQNGTATPTRPPPPPRSTSPN